MLLESTSGRFWKNVDRTSQCWVWTAHRTAQGYGLIRVLAHRFAYEDLVGPIDGKQLHHACENPACVNPDHLNPLTPEEHALLTAMANSGARTHCPHGHEYTPQNTRLNTRGHRICKACRMEWQTRSRAKTRL